MNAIVNLKEGPGPIGTLWEWAGTNVALGHGEADLFEQFATRLPKVQYSICKTAELSCLPTCPHKLAQE